MTPVRFSDIAARYPRDALIQKPAAETLLRLLDIGGTEDVLDLGCGPGHLTARLRELTRGRVVGVDPSPGMIREARRRCRGLDIAFRVQEAETLEDREAFHVIVCNSALQWFREPAVALRRCHRALRRNGRIGVQAPAKRIYSPNFLEAVDRVARDPRTRETFARFRSPWFFLETADAYRSFFEAAGFRVLLAELVTVETRHTPEEVYRIFASGAAAAYLNPDCYAGPWDPGYAESFRGIVREAFRQQADETGQVALAFHRIYLVAAKESPARRGSSGSPGAAEALP